jgi:hypothetical protein
MRTLLVAAALASACTTNPCKQGTIYLSLTFADGAEAADQLRIALRIDGGTTVERDVSRVAGRTSDQVEIGFANGYPSGATLSLVVTVLANGISLASAGDQFIAERGCTARSLALALALASTSDLGASDLPPTNDFSSNDSSMNIDLSTTDLSGETLLPNKTAWTSGGGGTPVAASGAQLGVTLGGSIGGGFSAAASGATLSLGALSSDGE